MKYELRYGGRWIEIEADNEKHAKLIAESVFGEYARNVQITELGDEK